MKREQSVPAEDKSLFQSLMSQGCSSVEAARIAAEQDTGPRRSFGLGQRVRKDESAAA